MSNISLENAARLLTENNNILILCHARPDGDTLGSAYGLSYALRACGKNVRVFCSDEIPKRLKFISELGKDEVSDNQERKNPSDENGNVLDPNGKTFNRENPLLTEALNESGESDKPESEMSSGEKTFICAIDTAETHLLGESGQKYADKIDLKLDHHPGGTEYAAANYIDGSAAATGEIIFELILLLEKHNSGKLTESAATALYAAVSSDTGCFKYSNVTSHTMHTAACLIEHGADSYGVCHRLFEIKPLSELRIRQFVTDRMLFYRNGSIAVLSITNDFKKDSGLNEDDTGWIVSELREIEGVELSVTLRQDSKDPEKFKISMRSGLNISASALCAIFGGGGHERAAGATMSASSPEEAEKELITKVLAALETNQTH